MGTNASGATTAVLRPVQSRASTRSPWPAPCSAWRAATHTARLVRPWPRVGMEWRVGLVLRKVPPRPASSQPRPRALLSPAPSPYVLFLRPSTRARPAEIFAKLSSRVTIMECCQSYSHNRCCEDMCLFCGLLPNPTATEPLVLVHRDRSRPKS